MKLDKASDSCAKVEKVFKGRREQSHTVRGFMSAECVWGTYCCVRKAGEWELFDIFSKLRNLSHIVCKVCMKLFTWLMKSCGKLVNIFCRAVQEGQQAVVG